MHSVHLFNIVVHENNPLTEAEVGNGVLYKMKPFLYYKRIYVDTIVIHTRNSNIFILHTYISQ